MAQVSIRLPWLASLSFGFALALGLAGFHAGLSLAADSAAPDGVTLVSLDWNAYNARLAQAKSKNYKYTLVDAWASNCGPCKENFPHLIEMHKSYGGKGLQVVSLSLDDISKPKDVEAARSFLREKKAPFLNILLSEEWGVGYEKLEINAIPAVFIYDGDGKLVKRFTMDDPNHQFTYEEVEKAVASLLGDKPAASR